MADEFVPIARSCHSLEDQASNILQGRRHEPEMLAHGRGAYVIHDIIGIGGGGTVYSGMRVTDGCEVALKYIHEDTVVNWGVLNGFHVPAEFLILHILSTSGRSGVIQMFDWFQENGFYVLVMEHVPHVMDLNDFLDDHGPLSEDLCRDIIRQLASTILHCHDQLIVHRDIKVENVLINPSTNEVTLIDFGCGTKLKDMPELQLAGTPIFYPPEWYAKDRYYGDRLDVWCLGILLYILVEDRMPFGDKHEIVNCKVRHSRGRKFSKSYRKFLKSLMHKDEQKRPSVEDVLSHPWLHADTEESKKKKGLLRRIRKFFKR